jgi:transaldolase
MLCPVSEQPEQRDMQIFIDSADVNEIRDAAAMGVIDGVTTNPSLVAQTGRPFKDVIRDICEIVDGPISAEVYATDTQGILKEGRELAAWHPNVVVKVPLIPDGLKAVRIFAEEGIKTNVTLASAPRRRSCREGGRDLRQPVPRPRRLHQLTAWI